MAQDSSEASDGKHTLLDRRSLLKLTGAAAVAGTGLGAMGSASAATTVDLGNEGLRPGDRIDDYLETHFTSNTTVIIPEGEYQWRGGGLTGTYSNANLIGDGNVVFRFPDGHSHRPSLLAEDDVVVANITIRGTAGRDKHRIRFDARDPDANILVHNVDQPDGGQDLGMSIGYYVGSQHSGTITFRDCIVKQFPNNGIYASAPQKSGGGEVHVVGGLYRNNNISNVRVGSSGSSIRDVVSIQDGKAPRYESGARNQRGLWIRTDGNDLTVSNVDADHTWGGANAPLLITARSGSGSGTVRDMRIRTGTDRPAIMQTTGDWDGSNVQVSGDGSYTVPDWVQNVSRGNEATVPDLEPRDVADLESGTGNWNLGSDTGSIENGNEFAIVANEGVRSLEYSFTTDGPIRKVTDADARSAESNDEIVSNGDGTYTATGITGNGYGDTYLIAGTVIAFDTGAASGAYRLILNNQEVSQSGLVGGSGNADGGSGSDATADDPRESGTAGTTFEVSAVENGPKFTYEFTVDGSVEKVSDAGDQAADRNDSIETGDGRVTVTGVTGNGYGDTYLVDGSITAFDADTDMANLRLQTSGDNVTALTLTHPSQVVFDAEEAGEAGSYVFEASGGVEHVGGGRPTERTETDDGVRVTGSLADGTHRFRYGGSVNALQLEGTVSVSIDDNAP
ncbi:hypothetical protein ACKVMT_04065 [Halobacteriales archaeon Cl-PHB]